MDNWAEAVVLIERADGGVRVIRGPVREQQGWLQVAAPFIDGEDESSLPRSIPAHRVIEVTYEPKAEQS